MISVVHQAYILQSVPTLRGAYRRFYAKRRFYKQEKIYQVAFMETGAQSTDWL